MFRTGWSIIRRINLFTRAASGTVPLARGCTCRKKTLILLMMDQPVRNMYRKIVNVKKENKSVSSWKRNKEIQNSCFDGVSPYEICGGRSGTEISFPLSVSVFPCQCSLHSAVHSFSS